MQADEVRYKEDMPALGLNWIRLGLDDVLYDPKTKTIYTPNTNSSVKVGEGGIAADDKEQRYNPYRDEKGRFASGGGGKSSGKSRGKGLTKRRSSSTISHKERVRLSHQIATDHPEWKTPGITYCYENRNHFYTLSADDFGEYTFYKKIQIKGNEERIKSIRMALGEWGK